MFAKLIQTQGRTLSRRFSTYYTFQDSIFNFALNVCGTSLLNSGDPASTLKTIEEAHQKGVNRLIVSLKENNDENDVAHIVNHVKSLQQKFPDLMIQGVKYPMMFSQKTKAFLHNEFLFGLKGAQLVSSGLYPQTFFLVESNDLFKSVLGLENPERAENALFNFDVLEEAQRTLEFANLVLTLKYEDGMTTPENLNKFYELFKKRNIGFDLELNKAFIKEVSEDKRKNSADFVKFAYGFEPHIKALKLYDFLNAEEEVEGKKVTKAKKVDIGEGTFDFKLLFDLIKMSKFKGVVIFPSTTTGAAIEGILKIAEEKDFKTKNEKEVLQYALHKERLKNADNQLGGVEFTQI